MKDIGVYLASRYSRIDEMNVAADDLRSAGFEVTSRWLNGDHQISDDGLSAEATHELRTRFAEEDWNDLMAARVVVSFTETPRSSNSRGGRHVEYGAALATGKLCVIVGPAENVFHCLPQVVRFDTWSPALDFIIDERHRLEAVTAERATYLDSMRRLWE